MKIVFFGTPEFAAYILEKFYLVNQVLGTDHEIVAVVSKPDKPQGRSLKLESTDVKKTWEALGLKEKGIPLFQPEKTHFITEELQNLEPDLFVVVAYGEILKEEVLKIPKIAAINIHASLLPKYRGASPITKAILEGEAFTGITVIHLVKKMDAGSMIVKEAFKIEEKDTFKEVEAKLKILGVETLFLAIDRLTQGLDPKEEQDESQVTFAPKVTPQDLEINWENTAFSLHNQIRAFSPKPGAWTWVTLRGEKKRLKILKAVYLPQNSFNSTGHLPKEIVLYDKTGLVLAAKEGFLRLEEVQLEGKKEMNFLAFISGFNKECVSFL